MNKKHLGIAILAFFGLLLPTFSSAQVRGISEETWDATTNDYWFNQKCDEVVNQDIYAGQYGVYLDNFINPSSNPGPLYLHANKVITRGNHLLYNLTRHPRGDGMTIFNRDLLEKKGWKVNPGEEIRHMSTAEEVSNAKFSYDWSMDIPFTAFDGKKFSKPNYRSDGSHPERPTLFPNWDSEFRTITLYDNDDNLSTTANNRAIVECQRTVIRRCGDGILDTKYGEKCDPKDPNKTGWGNAGCSATCEPITKTLIPPQCNSQYNGQTVENLMMGNHLCNPGSATEFAFNEASNTWTWKCNGEAGTTPVACSATKAPKKVYDLALSKELSNQTKGPFQPGSPVNFQITVVNQGNQPANTFTVTDYLPAALELTDTTWKYDATTRGVSKTITQTLLPGQSVKLSISTRIKADFTGDRIVNLAEITMDDGDDVDSTPKNCQETGKENEKECSTDEDDNDREEIPLTKYDLALTKRIKNKKAAYALGETLEFEIKVINQGNKVARNIEVTDYLPEGLELVSKDWTFANGKATKLITETIAPATSKTLTMQVRIKPDFKGTKIENFAEISRDNSGEYNTTDKDSTPDSNKNNDCYVAGKHLVTGNGKSATAGNCNDSTDEDDHDGDDLVIQSPNYDLALTKKIKNKKAAYALGETLEFEIMVINQGDKIARNIEVTDYLPAGLELNDAAWTLNGDKATRVITQEILPGKMVVLTMQVRIKPDFKGTKIENFAEISRDNSGEYNTTDKDSTPDSNKNNDCYVAGKHLVTGNGKSATAGNCNDTTDEDDHDGDELIVKVHPPIKKDLLGDPNKLYKPGDLVGFKMPFHNPGATRITKVSVKDYLPLNLEYVSSELHGVEGANFKTYKTGGIDVIEYAYFDLDAGQEGYLLLTGRVKETNLTERINTVYILENDIVLNYDTEPYKLHEKKLAIEKSVDLKTVAVGDIVTYTIKVSVLTGSFDTLVVNDLLPKHLEYQAGSYKILNATAQHQVANFATGTTAEKRENLTWTLNFPNKITKGQSFQIQLKAKFNGTSTGIYTNTACVQDPKTPSEAPLCDDEDISPKPPKDNLKIKKYVNKKLDDAGREDNEMTDFAYGQTGFFTLEVRDTSTSLTGFTVTDVVEGNLEYLDSRDLLNNAFTGVYLRDANNKDAFKYTTNLSIEDLGNKRTKLTWKVVMTEGFFLPGDRYVIKFKTKIHGEQTNVGVVTFSTPNTPNGRDEDPASVKQGKVSLKIQKEVAKNLTDKFAEKITLSSGKEAFFKLTISGATAPLTGFRVEDTLTDTKLLYLTDSQKLDNNAFTGVITFKNTNGTNPKYIITPTVVADTTAKTTKLVWKVDMKDGRFMPGDVLTIFFKVKKISSSAEKNIAKVCYPTPSQNEKCEEDPAEITPPNPGGGTPPPSGGGGGGGWYAPSCGDGYKQGNEICDLGRNGGTIGSDGKLFSHTNEYNTKYAGYTCNSNCRLVGNGEKVAPQCFNLQNGSISIMKGEVLPFYWNLESQLGKGVDKKEYLKKYFAWKDSSEKSGKIDLESMRCYFVVYGPGVYGPGMNELYSFDEKCIAVDGWSNSRGEIYPAIKSYIEQNKKGWFGGSELVDAFLPVKNVFDSLDNWNYSTLLPLSSKLLIKNFGTYGAEFNGKSLGSTDISEYGEYKVALEKITYQKYASPDKEGKVALETKIYESDDRICEVDFAVTDHYMVQRSPYGAIKSDSPLTKYKTIRGDQTFASAFEKQIKGSDYAVPQNMVTLFNTFKNKYQRLAKPVNGKTGLSKVPGKAIYLVDGESVDLKALISSSNKPFTLIATNPKAQITIKGSLHTNAMIMTAGRIIIDATENACNGVKTDYGHAGQLLQGIFYAGLGFESVGHENLKNTVDNLKNSQWCNYGNLHIKGVAIGDLSKLVNARRSELYTWFEGNGGGKTVAEKKDKIINGASVLVDYNPSLRGQLPPGAEEFNKALAVYRK